MDWGSLLYAPIYDTLGVPASFVVSGGGVAVALTVIDKTSGVDVGGSVDIQTIRPAADVRASEVLAGGITPANLDGGTLTIDGKAWLVDSHYPIPGPAGEAGGEVRMVLVDEALYA